MSSLGPLEGARELLEMVDQEVKEFTIEKFKVGTMIIHPRFQGAPTEKTIKAMRIWVPIEEKNIGPPYWDLTSSTLVDQLEPQLEGPNRLPLKIRLKKFGTGPRSRFMLTVLPS